MWEEMSKLNSVIIEYIRNNDKTKKGMLVAGVDPATDKVSIGWSLCYKKDKFNKFTAFNYAEGRALSNVRMEKYMDNDVFDIIDVTPFTVLNSLPDFLGRIKNFYKNKDIEYSNLVKHFITLFPYTNKEIMERETTMDDDSISTQ